LDHFASDIPTQKIVELVRQPEVPSEAFDIVLQDGKLSVRRIVSVFHNLITLHLFTSLLYFVSGQNPFASVIKSPLFYWLFEAV
jgi:hypothetical protein